MLLSGIQLCAISEHRFRLSLSSNVSIGEACRMTLCWPKRWLKPRFYIGLSVGLRIFSKFLRFFLRKCRPFSATLILSRIVTPFYWWENALYRASDIIDRLVVRFVIWVRSYVEYPGGHVSVWQLNSIMLNTNKNPIHKKYTLLLFNYFR